jgi:hypothetical protein
MRLCRLILGQRWGDGECAEQEGAFGVINGAESVTLSKTLT